MNPSQVPVEPPPEPRREAPPRTTSSKAVPATGMRYRFSRLWDRVLDWLFAPVRFPEEEVERLRALAERGTMVYVARTAGLLSFLYFNWALRRLGLPLAHYVNGVGPRTARLFGRGLVPDAPAADADDPSPDEARLAATVAAGHPALVYLWRRARALTGRKDTFPSDHAAALVRLQRRQDRPVLLVPLVLLVGPFPGRKGAGPSLLDLLFGPREAPGRLRTLLTFLRFRKRARVKVGRPIDLAEVIPHTQAPDPEVGRKLRGVLAQYLAREERVITGPWLKDPARVRMEILRDVRLRDALAEIADLEQRKIGDVHKDARRYLEEIAARFSPMALGILDRVLRVVFNRIYDGIEVDRVGLDRVRTAARSGPLIFCPTHRSHMDYLVLSWVLFQEGLHPPHIAAGKNLSFWPLGPILRRGGAYFLRRSFRDNKVYSAVFRAYVRKLIQEGFSQEFFIEGTRSRTGKMLPPRLGMVAYELDAFLESSRTEVQMVPVSVGYTRVIEAGSYTEELLGGEKRKENVGSLLKAGEVLRHRYGRIYIQFGEPIPLARFLAAHGYDASGGDAEKRRVVRSLGYHVAYGIDRLTTVTPAAITAAALLSDRRRGMELDEVLHRAQVLVDVVRGAGARLAAAVRLDAEGRLDPAPVREALEALRHEGLLQLHRVGDRTVVEMVPDGRLGLDYYKNALTPFLSARSIVSHALFSFRDPAGHPTRTALRAVRNRARDLSNLLSQEFVFQPDRGFDAAFDETLDRLVEDGLVSRDAETIAPTPAGEPVLEMLRQLTLNLVEGYWIAAGSTARALADGPIPMKDLVGRVLQEGRLQVLTGRLSGSEALSKPIVQGALAAWVDRGHLERGGKRGEQLSAAMPDALMETADGLAAFVGQPRARDARRLTDGARPALPAAD